MWRYLLRAFLVLAPPLALTWGCEEAAPQGEIRVVAKGTYTFEGSACRLFELQQYNSGEWMLKQRFSTCSPPIEGLVGTGSKPWRHKGDVDLP